MELISINEARAKGLTTYYTGKPCKHGHITIRFVTNGCAECKRLVSLKKSRNKVSKERGVIFIGRQIFKHEGKLTHAVLKQVLYYDKDTGIFTWLKRDCSTFRKAGMIAGTISDKGYIKIKLFNKNYYAHRLAIFYVKEAWPIEDVDHKNHVTTDNRYENLREADHSFNMENKIAPAKNKKTGLYLGVFVQNGIITSRITSKGVSHCLGTFSSQENAYEAYIDAKRKLHLGGIL